MVSHAAGGVSQVKIYPVSSPAFMGVQNNPFKQKAAELRLHGQPSSKWGEGLIVGIFPSPEIVVVCLQQFMGKPEANILALTCLCCTEASVWSGGMSANLDLALVLPSEGLN